MPTTSYSDLPINDSVIYRINNNYHYFDVSLINLDGRSQMVKPSAIKELVIEDKFQNFYQIGYIVIDNSFDMIERDFTGSSSTSTPSYYSPSNNFQNINNISTTQGTGNFQSINNVGSSTSTSIPLNGFIFKGDSRDILRIDIMPSLDTNNPSSLGDLEQQKLFRMYFDFVIYHSEDVQGDRPDQKLKKLYFWDIYYELLRTQNTYFSTANYVSNNSTTQTNRSTTVNSDLQKRTDTGRSIKTGKAIRELINETFNSSDTGPARYPASFVSESLSDDDPFWDMGSTTVFFSAPAQYKALDALYYLLDRHVSNADSNYDQCFLRIERFPRVFTLTNLKSLFDNAYNSDGDIGGNEYIETVKIAGYTTLQENGQGSRWGYELQLTPKNELYLDKYGTIRTFSYSDMSGIFTQREFTSRIVHSYDNETKTFQIDQAESDFEKTRDVFFNNYGRQLKGATAPFFNAGEMRQNRYNVQTEFTSIQESSIQQDSFQRLSLSRNKSLYAGIFTSNVVSFRLPGSTHRQAGKFIGIDRDGAVAGSAFDNKVLGIYFILEVKHLFFDGEYVNEIKCVKTYHATPINSDTTI